MPEEQAQPSPDADKDNGTAVAPPPAKKGKAAPKRAVRPGKPKDGRLPPFKVILHNDDVNEAFHVARTIVRLTPLGPSEAMEKMSEAHLRGAALLLVTHRERAELYVEQFASCGLTVTAEPDA